MQGYFMCPRVVFEMYAENKDYIYAYMALRTYARFQPMVISGIKVEAGQLLITLKELSELFMLSEDKTRYILKRFKADSGIITENLGKKGILITLLPLFLTGNYGENADSTAKRKKMYSGGTYSGTSRQNINNGEGANGKKNGDFANSPDFHSGDSGEKSPTVTGSADSQFIPALDTKRADEWARSHVPKVKKRQT